MLAKGGTFDGFQFGKGLAELGSEEIVPLFGNVVLGSVIVGTQQDVALQENLWIIQLSLAKQGIVQWTRAWEGDRDGKSEGRNRVGWDLAVDSAGRRLHISVADTDFLPAQIVYILEGEMVQRAQGLSLRVSIVTAVLK
jgi:hypothetical protein